MANILIIDDEISICKLLARPLRQEGHMVAYVLSLSEGLAKVSSEAYDIVFLDVNLPDGNGLEALPTITEAKTSPEVIIITGQGDPDGAELAIKSGAWTYIEKPPSIDNIKLQLHRVLQYRNEKMRQKQPLIFKREHIVGNSPQLSSCLDQVATVAASNVNVLITGETGTGKELFARAIHNNSGRAKKPFVVVDCASLPETLVESTLFGHEKGAFTGAQKDRTGLIKDADTGTLFLDELGELPLALQKDFLRVLQEYRFRPVGSNREVESDFRLIAATNRDLQAMVSAGQFRQDLLYRVQSFIVELPPLRVRPQDIKEIAIDCMTKMCEKQGIESKGFSSDFFEALTAYDWPGNVRELINTMEMVFTIARFEPTLFPMHLPTVIRALHARTLVSGKEKKRKEVQAPIQATDGFRKLSDVRETALSKIEKQYLTDLLLLTNGDIPEACRISGLSQSRLYYLMKKYQIQR
jgi:two-component system, NtrC family, response regulator